MAMPQRSRRGGCAAGRQTRHGDARACQSTGITCVSKSLVNLQTNLEGGAFEISFVDLEQVVDLLFNDICQRLRRVIEDARMVKGTASNDEGVGTIGVAIGVLVGELDVVGFGQVYFVGVGRALKADRLARIQDKARGQRGGRLASGSKLGETTRN